MDCHLEHSLLKVCRHNDKRGVTCCMHTPGPIQATHLQLRDAKESISHGISM